MSSATLAFERVALLDRDGTLIEDRHYLKRKEEVVLVPQAVAGLRELGRLGFALVVVSNQSGIGRGYFDERSVAEVHEYLRDLLEKSGVRLQGIYWCPHRPEEGCACRKPKTGLVLRAAQELGFDPGEAIVIGDRSCDVELGKNLGVPSVLVGDRASWEKEDPDGRADHHAPDLLDAAAWIGSQPGHNPHTRSGAGPRERSRKDR